MAKSISPAVKNRIWFLIPLAHFIVTFVTDRKVFNFDTESAWSIFWSVEMDDTFSHEFQSMMLYAVGKVIAGIIIFLMWYGIYSMITKKIPVKISILFCAVSLVVGFVLLLSWPDSFNWQDGLTTYAFAKRLIPWYWHSFFTSAVFVGCMSALPLPVAVSFFQMIFFNAGLTFLYYRLEKEFNPKIWFKILFWVIYLAPETYTLITNGYRNCFYAILCMYYLTYICMEVFSKSGKTCSAARIVIMVLLSVFISIWRTEGILVGIVGVLILVFRIFRIDTKKKIMCIAGFLAAFILMSLPQKVGDKTYYHKDYLIISTVQAVKDILNNPQNVDYDGFEEDLEALSAYVPIEYILIDGTYGMREYFYSCGNEDFDQSLKSEEIQDKYLRAFLRLAVHNFGRCMESKLNFGLESMGIDYRFDMEQYTGDYTYQTTIVYDKYWIGFNDIHGNILTRWWNKCALYDKFGSAFRQGYSNFRNWVENSKITVVIRIAVILLNMFIAVRELILLSKRKCGNIEFGVLAFLLLLQFVIITMTMPAAYGPYYYSVFYPSFVLQLIYFLSIFKKGKITSKVLFNER